jgi:hypothetical protein
MTTTSLHRRQLAAVTVLAAGAAIGVTGYAASAQAAPAEASAGATQASSTVAQKAAPGWARLDLKPSSPALKDCFPHASAKVTVKLTADEVGSDRFQIRARGLQPRTPYTVFLLEKAGAPFGAAEYIGDFTTNRHGQAHNTYNLIVEEAFAFNNETQDRTDLNSVGVWFADPADDDDCLGSGSPVTGFDGDASAGVQMLNSRARLLP